MLHENNESLAHFGIFGMKWGVRRYQNEDGTLTEEGKKRYRSYIDVDRDFKRSMEKHSDAANRVRQNGSRITQMVSSLKKDYEKHFNSFKLNEKDKNKVWDQLHRFWGEGPDDEEYYQYSVEDYLNNVLADESHLSKSLKQKKDQYDKLQKEYWDDIHTITKEVLDKYGDEKIAGKNNQLTSAYFIVSTSGSHGESLLSQYLNTSVPSYLSRNEDDWMFNDAYYEALERLSKEFSIENYNRRFNK